MQSVQTTLPIGSLIHNRYRVEALLGKGGFGAVYRVRDQRVKGNLFALKEVIDPNSEERERFAFECNVLKRLDHSALPRVYQEFEDELSQRSYMLMDFVDGPNLEQLRLQQPEKRFSLDQVLLLIAPIFSAVSHLHSQKPPIIHRDIKPANIIVPKDSQETVLVDLGIAKEYDQEGTTTAVRRCSPGYGAPEQYARGTNPRTDIYGLGATLYALLTGIVPMDALYRMTQLGSKDIDPLEPIRNLAPSVPPHIADAIFRAMSINSNDRFTTVDELWQAIQPNPADLVTLPSTLPTLSPVPVESFDVQKLSNTGVITKVYAVPPSKDRIYPGSSTPRRRPALWMLFFGLLALLALGTGLVFGTHFFTNSSAMHTTPIVSGKKSVPPPHMPGITPTHGAAAVPTHLPTTTPIHVPTTTPTGTQSPLPTTTPGPISTPVSGSYPQLQLQYHGNISDQYTSPATNTTMDLSHIQQKLNDPHISGHFSVGPALVGNGDFTGIVTSDNHIQFVVPSYNGLLPLYFTGIIQPDGGMHGDYCSARQNGNTYQCDKNNGGYGTWQTDPPAHQSSLPPSDTGTLRFALTANTRI